MALRTAPRASGDPEARKLTGLRRVDWVRVHTGASECRAEVIGVAHRLPTAVAVPLHVAARLGAAGVPVVVHRCDEG